MIKDDKYKFMETHVISTIFILLVAVDNNGSRILLVNNNLRAYIHIANIREYILLYRYLTYSFIYCDAYMNFIANIHKNTTCVRIKCRAPRINKLDILMYMRAAHTYISNAHTRNMFYLICGTRSGRVVDNA